jgi:hypothetical protein
MMDYSESAYKERLIDMLLNDTLETVIQWAVNGDIGDLRQFLEESLNYGEVDREDLEAEASGRGLLDDGMEREE